ncbi:MAG: hypothetical protein MMC23_007939, partial [Stictis urceolatum]|nr:hypothetical protein [Stictis urceolata]
DTNLIDITNVQGPEVLARLSTALEDLSSATAAAVTYPATLTHHIEAKALLAKVTTSGPKTWLMSLTNSSTKSRPLQPPAPLSPHHSIPIHALHAQSSVIAKLPGTTSNQFVAGAYFNSTGGPSTARGPGADDDGSGVVILLETLRILVHAKLQPRNLFKFHFYSGEEGRAARLVVHVGALLGYRQERACICEPGYGWILPERKELGI